MHLSYSAASRVGLAGLLAVVTMMAAAVALVLTAPPVAAQPDDDAVEVTEAEIRGAQGDVLTTIDEFPDTVQPDPDTEFGGPTRFTDAVRSADGAWLAIGSSGVAHGYGWLHELSTDAPHLVAFQFGGSVQSHSFSPDDRFALFTIATPAETELLKVVDRGDIAEHASDTGFVVGVDEEGEPPFAYEFAEWRAPHTLCFTFDGTPYCVDAETQHVERQAEPDEPADDDVDEREAPVGGVETGLGGAADRPEPLLPLAAALLLSAGALALVRRRRRV